MKVILSRKGFDFTSGGFASPILEDRRMISLPIPELGGVIRYSDIMVDRGQSCYDIINMLGGGQITIKGKKQRFTRECRAHLDPDIRFDVLKRAPGWMPSFGQSERFQTMLTNQDVTTGDLFLFFGWYRKVSYRNGGLTYERPKKDLHIIYGYLQVGNIINVNNDRIPTWLESHPHVAMNGKRDYAYNNVIYLTSPRLNFCNKPGAGIFNFDDNLVLTDLSNENSARSNWNLPACFKEVRDNYSIGVKKWEPRDDRVLFQTIGRSQEVLVTDNEQIAKWAKALVSQALSDDNG
jgi:hypothetical protein